MSPVCSSSFFDGLTVLRMNRLNTSSPGPAEILSCRYLPSASTSSLANTGNFSRPAPNFLANRIFGSLSRA
jgi:hypothetical protein